MHEIAPWRIHVAVTPPAWDCGQGRIERNERKCESCRDKDVMLPPTERSRLDRNVLASQQIPFNWFALETALEFSAGRCPLVPLWVFVRWNDWPTYLIDQFAASDCDRRLLEDAIVRIGLAMEFKLDWIEFKRIFIELS